MLACLDEGTSTEGRIRGHSGSTKKDHPLALLAGSMTSQALDTVIGQLIDHPAVREIAAGSDVSLLERPQPARTRRRSSRWCTCSRSGWWHAGAAEHRVALLLLETLSSPEAPLRGARRRSRDVRPGAFEEQVGRPDDELREAARRAYREHFDVDLQEPAREQPRTAAAAGWSSRPPG